MGRTTTAKLISNLKESDIVIPTPIGVNLKDKSEQMLWMQYTSMRLVSDWRVAELLLIHKLIKLETRIIGYEEEIEKNGSVVENAKGTMVESAHVRCLDNAIRLQLSLVTKLSLCQQDTRAVATNATNAKNIKDVTKKSNLLARNG